MKQNGRMEYFENLHHWTSCNWKIQAETQQKSATCYSLHCSQCTYLHPKHYMEILLILVVPFYIKHKKLKKYVIRNNIFHKRVKVQQDPHKQFNSASF
jgi:hypothetical protein